MAALACGFFLAVMSAFHLQSQPWLGIGFEPSPSGGVRIVSVATPGPGEQIPLGDVRAIRDNRGDEFALLASDLVEEPDFFDSYEDLRDFLARQSVLASILRSGPVSLQVLNGAAASWSEPIAPASRPLGDLPPEYWVQIFVGFASLVIGVWVWSLRPTDPATRLFAIAGAMIMGSAYTAAIYSSRELALSGGQIRALSAINLTSTLTFGMATIAMFCCFPKRLMPLRWLVILPAIFVPWLLLGLLRQLPGQTFGVQLPALIQMLAILGLVCMQWYINRNDPRATAALRWLGLSVVIGAGAFVSIILAPVLFDVEPAMTQGYAFAFFLLIYSGLAIGISRSRLFDLDVWAFRVLFYAVGALLLVAVDAVLIYVVAIDRPNAFGVALLLVGFIYLPLRDTMARRLSSRPALDRHVLLRAVVDVAFGLSGEERAARWHKLLDDLFDPLERAPVDERPGAAALREDGLEMIVPGVAGLPATVLRLARGGRGLFRRDDVRLADELVALLRHVQTSREAYERGALEERRRIGADLHDDVGARLLTALHHRDVGEIKGVLREAMADIRSIVAGLSGDRMPLTVVLADLRHETALRLENAGITLHWNVSGDPQGAVLEYKVYKNLVSTVREVISNALRHAQANSIETRILIERSRLRMVITDDGIGFDSSSSEYAYSGNGLPNIHRRVRALSGDLQFGSAEDGGTRIELTLPIQEADP
jgi:two-component system sensor histidine kinase DevS